VDDSQLRRRHRLLQSSLFGNLAVPSPTYPAYHCEQVALRVHFLVGARRSSNRHRIYICRRSSKCGGWALIARCETLLALVLVQGWRWPPNWQARDIPPKTELDDSRISWHSSISAIEDKES
jgi:hypothetical protein